MSKKCICELCTCRRHKCPCSRPPPGSFSKITEYNKNYHLHPLDKVKSCKKPDVPIQSDVPLSDVTINRQDYVRYPVHKPQFREPEPYKPPPGEIDLLSSYTKDYTDKPIEPAKAIKPEERRETLSKFDSLATYTADYRKWNLERVKSFKPDETWEPPTVKFEGQSTMTKDFRRYNERPRESCKPLQNPVISTDPFPNITIYRDQFIRHPLASKLVREREVYKTPGVAMEGVTIMKKDFQGRPGEKTKSFKPEQHPIASEVPLEGMTVFRRDYQKWPVKKPDFHMPDPYVKPEGEIDLNTTHKMTYRPQPLESAIACKPIQVHEVSGPFQNTTCYRTEFKEWRVKPPKAMLKPEYQPNNAPFDGLSTTKAHFGPKQCLPATSCRPKVVIPTSGPFDGNTLYRTEYTPKQAYPCPAALVDTQQAQHTYFDTDMLGHKFYQPIQNSAYPASKPAVRYCNNAPIAVV